jgi:hypothetical protein
MMPQSILDQMLYAICVTEENTVALTISEDRKTKTIYLTKEMAANLAKDIIHYAQLL